jgi:RNA polymerase sigma-70 factor (sigma-E family)
MKKAGMEFVAFVSSRRGSLRRTAWALTGDEQLAEDLVQTALMKVWPRWSRIVASGDPEAYVKRIIYTPYLAWWSRKWTRESPSGQVPETSVTQPERMDPSLVDALRALPRRQRAVVVCRYLDDLSERQTADVLGCSVGTVKSQTSRALERLRSLIKYDDLLETGEDSR